MVYGYIRVSTGKQTAQNQKLVIREYCRRKRIHGIQWVSETISGTKPPPKRKLGQLLLSARQGDTVIVTELSRLGRSLIMIMNVLQEFLDKGVKVKAIKEGYECDDSIVSKVIAFAFGLSAEIERQLISERTKAGLVRAVRSGKRLGRPKGVRPSRYKLTGKGGRIRRGREAGKSKSALARELGCTRATLDKYMKMQGIR